MIDDSVSGSKPKVKSIRIHTITNNNDDNNSQASFTYDETKQNDSLDGQKIKTSNQKSCKTKPEIDYLSIESLYKHESDSSLTNLEPRKSRNNLYNNLKAPTISVEPPQQRHASSLFINLCDTSSISKDSLIQNFESSNSKVQARTSLFISQNKSNFSLQSGTSITRSHHLLDTLANQISSSGSSSTSSDCNLSLTMNHCNFINTYMSASRRRAVSATPTASPAPNLDNCRSSSTEKLAEPADVAANGAESKGITASESTETVCGLECTPVTLEPLKIDVTVEDELMETEPHPLLTNQPIGSGDILHVDIDEDRLDDECKRVELEVEALEQRVEELERKRFADDVPRTLIDRVLEKRRELRDLEVQLYKLDLDSEESDRISGKLSQISSADGNLSPSSNNLWNEKYINTDSHVYIVPEYNSDRFYKPVNVLSYSKCNSVAKFGSQLKPGQENTADILNVIPPSSSLQHKQYLSKASTGTDVSLYSQLPIFGSPHKHHLGRQISPSPQQQLQSRRNSGATSPMMTCGDDKSSGATSMGDCIQHQHHNQQHRSRSSRRCEVTTTDQQQQDRKIYISPINSPRKLSVDEERRQKVSPIRPTNFNCSFEPIRSQDLSSGTSSSSSPPH